MHKLWLGRLTSVPRCQGYHWAEPIILRQNSRRNLCCAPSALTRTPLTHSHCQSIFPESKFCVCLLCSAALLPPVPASGPLHCCSLAQNILSPDVSMARPLLSSLSLLTCHLLNTTHPAILLKTATAAWHSPAPLLPQPLGFVALFCFSPKHFSLSHIFYNFVILTVYFLFPLLRDQCQEGMDFGLFSSLLCSHRGEGLGPWQVVCE